MRRPLLSVLAVLLPIVAAAAPAAAQQSTASSRVFRRAFEPAVTPFLAATGFGDRTTDPVSNATYDYNNGLALGVQLDRPLTRRTALLVTGSVTPLSRVIVSRPDFEGKLDRALVGGVDLGFAARLKPAAPLFVYVGGGATMASRRAAGETDGFAVEPRVSGGLGIDLMRFERTGVRLMYIGHYVIPGTPDEARFPAESSTFDQTIILGGRYMLGAGSGDRR